MIYRRFLASALLTLLAPIGCQDDQDATIPPPADDAQTTDTQPVAKVEVPSLVWVQTEIQEGDFVLSLGHRGDEFHGGDSIEPAVRIMMGDAEIKDAVVHSSLIAEDGETVLAEESLSDFAATTEEEPAHYATGTLTIPQDAQTFLIRFRIKLPEVETESIYDLECKVSD